MWTRPICLPQTNFFFSTHFQDWLIWMRGRLVIHLQCLIDLLHYTCVQYRFDSELPSGTKPAAGIESFGLTNFSFFYFSLSPVFRHWRGLLWLGSPIPDSAWINGGTILFEKHPVLDWSILGTCSLSDRQLVASAYYSSTSITDLMVKHI